MPIMTIDNYGEDIVAEELGPDIEFIQVSLSLIGKLKKKLVFDVYVQRTSNKYSKLFKKGDELEASRVQQYTDKGIKFFYVTSSDYEIYNRYLDALGTKFLDPKSKGSIKDSALIMKELVQASIIDIHKATQIEPEQVQRAELVVNSCINHVEKNPNVMMKIIASMASYDYLYRHAIMCSMFSVMLAKADGVMKESTLTSIGLGAFLHDIGVCQLSFDPEGKKDLNAEERKEMNRHPEIGKRMLDAVKGVRDEVLFIIMQHHEQPNGQGYPNGLRGESIYRPARMVAIADSFSALVSNRPFREAVSAKTAIRIMKTDLGKFDKKLLEKFAVLILGEDYTTEEEY